MSNKTFAEKLNTGLEGTKKMVENFNKVFCKKTVNENYLSGKRCYISSAIEFSQDNSWRKDIIEKLITEFKLDVFDPWSDPKQQYTEKIQEAKKEKDFETIAKIAKSFVRKDLAQVDRSDLLIAFLKHGVPSFGVCHEIVVSNMAKKPSLIVSLDDDKTKLPIWFYGFINHNHMFDGANDLYRFLHKVNDGKMKDNDRWAFIYDLL